MLKQVLSEQRSCEISTVRKGATLAGIGRKFVNWTRSSVISHAFQFLLELFCPFRRMKEMDKAPPFPYINEKLLSYRILKRGVAGSQKKEWLHRPVTGFLASWKKKTISYFGRNGLIPPPHPMISPAVSVVEWETGKILDSKRKADFLCIWGELPKGPGIFP